MMVLYDEAKGSVEGNAARIDYDDLRCACADDVHADAKIGWQCRIT